MPQLTFATLTTATPPRTAFDQPREKAGTCISECYVAARAQLGEGVDLELALLLELSSQRCLRVLQEPGWRRAAGPAQALAELGLAPGLVVT